jgi:hypothetical protein
MRKLLYIFVLNFSLISNGISQELIYPEIIPSKTPIEFEMLYNRIQSTLIPKEKDDFLLLSHELQKYFNLIEENQLFFLIKSTIYKAILQFEFDFFIQEIDINNAFLNQIEAKLSANDKIYSIFDKWLINSIIADLFSYRNTPLLDQLGGTDVKSAKLEDMKLAAELRRKLRYLKPWFYTFDKLKPKEFTELTREASWRLIKMIYSSAKLFYFYTSVHSPPNDIQFFKLPPLPEGLKDTSFEEFAEMKDSMLTQIIPLDQEKMLEAQKLMDKIGDFDIIPKKSLQESKVKTWKPRVFDSRAILLPELKLPEQPKQAPQRPEMPDFDDFGGGFDDFDDFGGGFDDF